MRAPHQEIAIRPTRTQFNPIQRRASTCKRSGGVFPPPPVRNRSTVGRKYNKVHATTAIAQTADTMMASPWFPAKRASPSVPSHSARTAGPQAPRTSANPSDEPAFPRTRERIPAASGSTRGARLMLRTHSRRTPPIPSRNRTTGRARRASSHLHWFVCPTMSWPTGIITAGPARLAAYPEAHSHRVGHAAGSRPDPLRAVTLGTLAAYFPP
jgi:hypothetical protein